MTWDGLAGGYGTILMDPPWRYRTTDGITSRAKTAATSPHAGDRYSTLTVAEIARLPVGDLAADACHLYLWVTNPLLFGDRASSDPADRVSAAELCEGWGFRYVTLLTWRKTGQLGLGYYWRSRTEHVAFAVRGVAPIPPELRQVNTWDAPRGAHSVKPPHLADMAERVSPGPRVELFARAQRLGWDTWGNGWER